jgi:ubiquinone/menaquinone biosynthesis C-methylase UbiE
MKTKLCGNEMDRIPGLSFRIMALLFNVSDWIISPDNRLIPFGIRPGQTVVDYGCGTGRYLKSASAQVGDTGTVYAVDIHELAIESARKRISRYNLQNVIPVLTDGKTVNIADHVADMIYALDMFHMVKDPERFLTELCRILKPDGILYLEDGHQPRTSSRRKLLDSGCWTIAEDARQYLKCRPKRTL